MQLRRASISLLVASTLTACTDGSGTGSTGDTSTGAAESTTTGDSIEPVVDWPHVACDPLMPSFCPMPFPSNVYTVADESTKTGRRVQLEDDAMPLDYYGGRPKAEPWNRADGFTPGIAMLAHFPELVPYGLVGFPDAEHIGRSMEADCPSILLDAETGERVPHFVELDATAEDPGQKLLIMHPAIRLQDDHRYIVGYSKLRNGVGDVFAATPGFAALRDGTASDEASIEARRPLYADIFAKLDAAQVARDELQMAWDFTTASRENQTGWMLHMRDESLAMVGDDGPEYTITSVEDDYEPDHIAYRIFGEMTVPMYLDKPEAGGKLVFGDDGLPAINPAMPTANFSFEVLIPHAATQAPAGLIQYGHGLLGEKEQIESGHFLEFMDAYGYIMFGVDFIGMAHDDELQIGALIATGEFHRFADIVDRQHQGMLNSLLAMRMMKGRFAADPDYGGFIDPDRAYYHGISQGGIFGATYMALTTDVERGVLGVPGMPYNLLLSRSADFDPFFEIIRASYPDVRQQTYLLALTDMLWERTEPAGYAPYVLRDMLPGTPAHQVFINDAIGDHQVSTLGAHVMARTMGMPHVDTGIREIWGLDTVTAPHEGSGIAEYAFGLPPDPVDNLPQRSCEDPHGKLRKLPEFQRQLDHFLRDGVITNECTDGVCAFPDMSGCP